jgi:hypothetical protein
MVIGSIFKPVESFEQANKRKKRRLKVVYKKFTLFRVLLFKKYEIHFWELYSAYLKRIILTINIK